MRARAKKLLSTLTADLFSNMIDDGVYIDDPKKFLGLCADLDEINKKNGIKAQFFKWGTQYVNDRKEESR